MQGVDTEMLRTAIQWQRAGRRVVLLTVVRTWGSSPRPPGSLRVIRDDGQVAGSVSGGCIEGDLIERISVACSPGPTARTCAASLATRAASRIGDRSRNQAPSGNSAISSAATCSDSRVLPMPPMPTSVSSRALPSSAFSSPSSRSRPMNEVSCSGRLFGICRTGSQRPPTCTTR